MRNAIATYAALGAEIGSQKSGVATQPRTSTLVSAVMFKPRRSNLLRPPAGSPPGWLLAAADCQQPDEPLDRSGWLGSTRLNPPAGKGGHLDLLARLDTKVPQQLLPLPDLALGLDGEKGHELATSCTSAYGSYALPAGVVALCLAMESCGQSHHSLPIATLRQAGRHGWSVGAHHRRSSGQVLTQMARELAEKLRNNLTIDWQYKENVRARLRTMIKALPRRYKYPPDQEAVAIDLVLQRTEMIAEEWSRQNLGDRILAAVADALAKQF